MMMMLKTVMSIMMMPSVMMRMTRMMTIVMTIVMIRMVRMMTIAMMRMMRMIRMMRMMTIVMMRMTRMMTRQGGAWLRNLQRRHLPLRQTSSLPYLVSFVFLYFLQVFEVVMHSYLY